MRIRALYSFPHKLGAGRICHTAWQQIDGLLSAGVEVLLYTGSIQKPLSSDRLTTHTTLGSRRVRVPYRLLGTMRACALHDWIVASKLKQLAHSVDVVHVWPLGALRTLNAAAQLGIPTVLERPNAHTRVAYTTVQRECERIGVPLPANHEHAFKPDVLRKEETEYELATRLLCPSDFVVQTFVEQGFSLSRLARHQYGYDPSVYYPRLNQSDTGHPFSMLFVGVCAVRKGLHFALDAWLRSPAHNTGRFLIAGDFLPAYAEKLSDKLRHPSISVLGHRNNVPELMRNSDALILPSIEEGSPLVCAEAIGSGCVPVASNACNGSCTHMVNSLVHPIGDVDALTRDITRLYEERGLLERLRQGALESAPNLTWAAAGRRLRDVYSSVIDEYRQQTQVDTVTARAG